ncbi:MAG TPA: sigma-54 dependent transcriptional regulator [Candidatus Dormibacteraeota bacterium]|jgi:two-component system response regulator AtoC|nr:sigma-54 dependent transcriptional regulator [Candidatus Dormibacteraeota bacterium]
MVNCTSEEGRAARPTAGIGGTSLISDERTRPEEHHDEGFLCPSRATIGSCAFCIPDEFAGRGISPVRLYSIASLSLSTNPSHAVHLTSAQANYNESMPDRLPWIAEDPASRRLLELAEKVAAAPTTLLITGESGSGKDHLARLIHELGPRRDAPYLKIDCAALPPALVESELFGHERGSFTGAVDRKLGRLELGGAGTIVLDEVAALSSSAQTKLLRVLQERTFERLGGTETLRIEARLIAITNVDLQAAIAAGQFREDLFFRLSVLPLGVPPLRERRKDILPLADHLLASLGAIHNRPNWKLTEASRRMLSACAWPGNIRELRNALERAIVFGKGPELTPDDFPEALRAAAGGTAMLSGLRSLEQIERDVIVETLEATRYHISKSAEILGISRKTLLEKRKKYGLQ